jgi:hypothetical protein
MGRVSAKVFNVFARGAIAIDAGKAKGITKKTQLSVLRNGKVIARMVVTEVYDSFSIAEQSSKLADEQQMVISVGEDVISD